MNDSTNLHSAFACATERFGRIAEDNAFWRDRERMLAEREAQERQEAEANAAATHARRVAMIPVKYREEFTPSLSSLSPKALEACRRWKESAKLGIGLSGATGMGKTRVMCSILMRLRCSWLYLPASKLSLAVSDQWHEGGVGRSAFALLREAKRVKVLLLDDIGDEKHTEAVTAELKDLVEHRTSRGLPILWTSNLTPEQITAKHGERGAAIVRRLQEFTWAG